MATLMCRREARIFLLTSITGHFSLFPLLYTTQALSHMNIYKSCVFLSHPLSLYIYISHWPSVSHINIKSSVPLSICS